MDLNIHADILARLGTFVTNEKIPNIIFHGSSGSGKRTILNKFIHMIYLDDRKKMKDFVMYVNCAHGKGIRFIREELKFFAKTHINSNGGGTFKSVVLLNADKLTTDAQSALRRCIESFSHTTRFFMVVEDKEKLLRPILSRFCDIYVPEPLINGKHVNLYEYLTTKIFRMDDIKSQRETWLKKELVFLTPPNETEVVKLATKLYEKGYSGLDLITLMGKPEYNFSQRHELVFTFSVVKKDFRNEKLLITFILHFAFVSSKCDLKNITFM